MIKSEDECVGCSSLGLPCLGSACPNRNVIRFYCNKCECEDEILYIKDGDHLCKECLLASFEQINDDNYERYM